MARTHVFVHHLRRGFATNCSSSHCFVFLPGAKDELGTVPGEEYAASFVAASRGAKLPYVRLELDAARAADESVVAELGLPAQGAAPPEVYYRWTAPPALAKEIARWALMDGVVALGGPDFGELHPLAAKGKPVVPAYFGRALSRRDPLGFWTLLDERGTKLRLSFAQADHPQVQPFRSTWPETVDLKITERCRSGCAYCSQDARPDGAHAAWPDLLVLLAELANAKVMEVVLGGGEPTEHPDFAKVVGTVQQLGMRAAFTTRHRQWHERVDKRAADWDAARWAYSVDRADELEALSKLGRDAWLPTRPAIHVVMGTPGSQRENLEEIARYCAAEGLPLVLLGLKRTGRACDLEPLDDAHWLETCEAAGLDGVAIDAVLARKYDLELQRRGVPAWLYEVEDGRFAMHVDAVRGRCGPSSYCPPEETFPLPTGREPIRQAFDRINERLGPARLRRALELEQDAAAAARDEQRLVLLDAAMEGRCEACGEPGAEPVGGERGPPRVLCGSCRGRRT